MALSISLMFGRLGGVAGSNSVALLLDNYCKLTFYLSGSVLLVIAVLSFFIPNIHKKVSNSDQEKNVPRTSILSFRASVSSI